MPEYYKRKAREVTRARVESRDQSARRHGELDAALDERIARDSKDVYEQLLRGEASSEEYVAALRAEAGTVRDRITSRFDALVAENARLRAALEVIAGHDHDDLCDGMCAERMCEIAREALSLGEQLEGPGSSGVLSAEAPTTAPKDEGSSRG